MRLIARKYGTKHYQYWATFKVASRGGGGGGIPWFPLPPLNKSLSEVYLMVSKWRMCYIGVCVVLIERVKKKLQEDHHLLRCNGTS